MAFSNAGSILATLTQVDRMGLLADRVKNLPVGEFICILDFITAEFQQFLRAIDLINNEAIETLLEQLLDAFTLKIGQILEADQTTIFLINTDKNQLWYTTLNEATGQTQDVRLPMDTGILGYVARSGKSLNITQVEDCALFDPRVDAPPNYAVSSILCLPIFSSQNPREPVAVIRLLNKANNAPFTTEDEEHFRSSADSIGIILESCQSFFVAARNQRGVSALLKATTTLGESLDLQSTLKNVMDLARDLMQADRSTLFLFDSETNELWTKVAKADQKTMVDIRFAANKGIAGYVASTGQVVNISDAYTDPRFDPSTDEKTGYRTRNILCMPVFNAKGELIGVTQLINKHKGSFTNSDEAFLKAFNAQAGIALQNAQLFENVMVEKQYQKDMLQSLSDVVISTDLQGRIVTINDAALELLGCPRRKASNSLVRQYWETKLIDRYIWDVVPIENLQFRLEDCLKYASRYYVPEQNLTVGLVLREENGFDSDDEIPTLVIPDPDDLKYYLPWGLKDDPTEPVIQYTKNQVKQIEKSINLTVNPLTDTEGKVRGGLVILEDISREKRMKTTMYRYMTPGVAERVMALGEDALMVGERKEVTILFSDIRGYTSLTEDLEASDVVALLNQYFETMVEAVFSHEGTLDKFIGDALMAVFGAPLPLRQNHAWMAVKSALEMRHRLKEFNRSRANEPQIRIGIGMSSGEVVSGNIGSQKRMDYTVIGDGVNLSARLEQLTKVYGCDIILSEMTYELCSDKIWVRELDKVRVKGKRKAVSIYELIDRRSQSISQEHQDFLDCYHQGRKAYLKRDFKQAIKQFEAAEKMRPNDRSIRLHLIRSQDYLEIPPPESWDGIHTMTAP
ncbi:MAG: adenylate/guanylate cyclase domain-containing protein [Microcoleaceae cyanobacterium]